MHRIICDNRQDDDKVKEAKGKELENWKEFNVYEEIVDTGQPCISVGWYVLKSNQQMDRCLPKPD